MNRWQVWLIGLVMASVPQVSHAASLPTKDVQDINQLGQARGHASESINRLLEHAQQAIEQGLPERPIMNKIKEGLAKGASPERIQPVVRDMVRNLRDAREVLQDAASGGSGQGGTDNSRATEVMAEALGRGVTVDEVRSLGRSGGKGRVNQETLAFGAKGLAMTKEAGVPGTEGIPVIGEALRQGFRTNELLDLGREIKKHGNEFRADRNRIQEVKKAVERGERPGKIFERDRQSGSGKGGGGRESRTEDRESSKKSDHERSGGNGDRSGGDRDRIESREQIDRGRESRGSSDFRRDRGDRGGDSSGRGRGGRDD
ncbi:MAG: hypothetical protein OEZ41_04645 [Nitrospirota bacterium]|nr:hypothetical protein [Nitrospirota bacterium]MDH5699234.1 hypothetical protein [Nitrospirota bacterium]